MWFGTSAIFQWGGKEISPTAHSYVKSNLKWFDKLHTINRFKEKGHIKPDTDMLQFQNNTDDQK